MKKTWFIPAAIVVGAGVVALIFMQNMQKGKEVPYGNDTLIVPTNVSLTVSPPVTQDTTGSARTSTEIDGMFKKLDQSSSDEDLSDVEY